MATLTGLVRIGRDAQLKTLNNAQQTAVCNFAACYKYGRKLDDGYPVQWLDLTLFGKQAEGLAPYLLKGQLIAVVVNDIHIETFQRNDGTQGFKLVGIVKSVEFAGAITKPDGGAPQQQYKPVQQKTPTKPVNDFPYDDYDDSIPF